MCKTPFYRFATEMLGIGLPSLWVVRLSICQYVSYVERYINGEYHQKCVRTILSEKRRTGGQF